MGGVLGLLHGSTSLHQVQMQARVQPTPLPWSNTLLSRARSLARSACKVCVPPSPPVASPPPSPPSPDALGCIFTHNILSPGTKFRAQILVTPWAPGQQVLVDYGPSPVQIQRAWGAMINPVPKSNAFIMILGARGDEQGGFSFNGAGADSPTPNIQCVSNPPPPPFPSPPAPPFPPPPPPVPLPPPSPSPPPTSIFAPKVPKHLESTSSSCASVGLKWDKAHIPDVTPDAPKSLTREKLHDVTYEVTAQRADGTTSQIFSKTVPGTEAEVGGLLPSTKYALRVRSINGAGMSALSESTLVDTAPAMRAPDAPFELPAIAPSSECTSVELALPKVRGGCGGDLSLQVEGSRAGDTFGVFKKDLTGTSVVIDGLDPYTAYRFRVVAANGIGVSAAGPSSVPFLSDNGREVILAAPSAEPTSSASFRVWWKTSTCRPQLSWELLYARVEAATGQPSNEWHVLDADVRGTEYEVQSLRCPLGCSFRLRPQHIDGLDETYSKASRPVASTVLHGAPDGAVRVELTMQARPAGDDTPLSTLVSDVARSVGVDTSRFAVVEARTKRCHLVLDLLQAAEAPAPLQLAEQLGKLANTGAGGMEAGSVVLVVHSDGTTETLEVPGGLGAGAFAVGAAVVTALIYAALRSVRPAGSELPLNDPSPGGRRFIRSKKANNDLEEDDDDDDEDMDGGLLKRAAA